MQHERCMFFTGDDLFSKERAVKRYRGQLAAAGLKDTSYHIFFATEFNLDEFSFAIQSGTLFGDISLTVVKELEQLPKGLYEAFVESLGRAHPRAHIALVTGGKDANKKLYTLLSPLVKTISFRTGYKRDSERAISTLFKDYDKTIADNAVRFLLQTVGTDLATIDTIAENVTCYVGERKHITQDDVALFVYDNIESTAFDLTRAIGHKNADESLRILRRLVSDGKKPPEIIGALSWQMGRLYKSRCMLEEGMAPEAIGAAMKVNNYFLKEYMKQVNNFSQEELQCAFTLLLEADVRSKSTRFDARVDMDVLVLALCGVAAKKKTHAVGVG